MPQSKVQFTSQNTGEMLRRHLEEARTENLDTTSYEDKQELIAQLGIAVYSSEDYKIVRITSKLTILWERFSPQLINMASVMLSL